MTVQRGMVEKRLAILWKRGTIVSATALIGRRACSAFVSWEVACSALQKAKNLAGLAKEEFL